MKLPICSDSCVKRYRDKMTEDFTGYLQPNGQPVTQKIWDDCRAAFVAYHNETNRCVGCGKRTKTRREIPVTADADDTTQ